MQIFVAGTFIPRKNPIGKNLSVIKVFVVYFSIFLLKLHLPLKFLVQKCFNFAQNLLKIKSNFFRVMHETFKFMVVRHPFERLLSAYRYCLPRGRHKCSLLFNKKNLSETSWRTLTGTWRLGKDTTTPPTGNISWRSTGRGNMHSISGPRGLGGISVIYHWTLLHLLFSISTHYSEEPSKHF